MSRKAMGKNLNILGVTLGALLLCTTGASAGFFGLFGCCCEPCPHPYVHCQEGPPCIKFKCGCPKPVCYPCNLQY